jgi:indolepyruvate ferredoxin oxidoreductase alpha subunit
MGASEAERLGYIFSQPEKAGKCISLIGDGTECHSGLDATRNAIYRNAPGVKVILDNAWTAMTGGQPSLTSPTNLSGEKMRFDLPASLKSHGAQVVTVSAYDKKAVRKALSAALAEANKGTYTTLVVRDGACLQKSPASTQRVRVEAEACRRCNACLICPGLMLDANGVPVVNNLCSGCGGHTPACAQMCPYGVLEAVDLAELERVVVPEMPAPPSIETPDLTGIDFPISLAVAIRGVGGQGNLFFGRVLTQLAFLAGYSANNIIKGETHGMAQMGGPVISTFACGDVHSPVLLPGSANCLIVMEQSEVLRPDFLETLKPGGTILMAATKIIPFGLPDDQYPTEAQIEAALAPYHVVKVDVLGQALSLGDATGRSANVVMMGVLSGIAPFNVFPIDLWLKALKQVSPRTDVWTANYAAFMAGREYSRTAPCVTTLM